MGGLLYLVIRALRAGSSLGVEDVGREGASGFLMVQCCWPAGSPGVWWCGGRVQSSAALSEVSSWLEKKAVRVAADRRSSRSISATSMSYSSVL